jgi:hypothetical protein
MGIEFIYTETYHYHDTECIHYMCGPECFDLARSEVDDNLEHESDEFSGGYVYWRRQRCGTGATRAGC